MKFLVLLSFSVLLLVRTSHQQSPASHFYKSLQGIQPHLPNRLHKLLDKHAVSAFAVEAVRDALYGWEHIEMEPLVRRIHNDMVTVAEGCYEVDVTMVIETLLKGVEVWFVSGDWCRGWTHFKMRHLESISNLKTLFEPIASSTNLKDASFNNGSKGIPELLKLDDETKCKRDILHECTKGSVTMDTWVNQTLKFQRDLSVDTELNFVQFLGTHNSFNDKADGYGTGDFYLNELLEALSFGKWEFVWAQQWFTMTDQLNMGIRELMLDPVYVFDEMRLCHCGTTFKWIDRVINWIDKVLNTTIHFDSNELGCMPYDRTLQSGLMEIYSWLSQKEHKNEFILLHINDEGRKSDWNHIALIQKLIKNIFGNLMFTPLEKNTTFPKQWPSQRELLHNSKQILVYGERVQNDDIFPDFTLPDWDKDTVKYFTPFPQCGNYTPDQWYIVGGESQVVGPIYNGPEEEGLVVLENLPYLMQCSLSITSMDLVSPPLLSGAVWSWARGYPYVLQGLCSAINVSDSAHWLTIPCNYTLPCACRNTTDQFNWTLSTETSSWHSCECDVGTVFDKPKDGHQNWLLHQQALQTNNVKLVWINHLLNEN